MAHPLYPYRPRSASAISVDVQTLEERHRDWERRPHGHAFFEIIAVTQGAVADSAFVIPPGIIHDCREFGVGDGLVVRFLPDGVDPSIGVGLSLHADVPTGMLFDLFRRPVLDLMHPLVLEAATHADVVDQVLRMRRELAAKRAGYEFVVRSALQTVLVELARSAPGPAAPDAPEHRDLLTRAFADIDAHFSERDMLSGAAKRLGLTPAYLSTRMRRLTGRTFGDWVIERRMIEARRLLIVTDAPIAEVAEQVGYGDSESFVRRFRERHGVTPASWREKSRSSGS